MVWITEWHPITVMCSKTHRSLCSIVQFPPYCAKSDPYFQKIATSCKNSPYLKNIASYFLFAPYFAKMSPYFTKNPPIWQNCSSILQQSLTPLSISPLFCKQIPPRRIKVGGVGVVEHRIDDNLRQKRNHLIQFGIEM